MTSLFIPGMNKPERCSMCPAYHLIEVPKAWLDPDPTFQVKPFCALTQEGIKDIRNINRNCPLVEIPTPHGRLIDIDKLKEEFAMNNICKECDSFKECDNKTYSKSEICEKFIWAPTILEAEE